MPKGYGIIAAAGSGRRMGLSGNKALAALMDIPLLAWSVRALDAAPCIDEMRIAAHPEEVDIVRDIIRIAKKPCEVLPGGETRQRSVYAALRTIEEDDAIVLIHDAARPFLSQELIARVYDSALMRGSGIPALPVKDTIKRADEKGGIIKTLDRQTLRAVQTPQGFRLDIVRRAHESAVQEMTDDAALVEALGETVYLVEGDERCFKLTTPFDMEIAQYLARKI